MAKTHATLLTEIALEAGEPTPAKITAANATQQLARAIRRVSEDIPRVKRFSYYIESRTGRASATSSGYLVDTTETQFIVANDVGKEVHNTTDGTWAVVVTDGSNSTSKLKLSSDIMISGEDYEIYNKGCVSNKQINLEDIKDYVGENHGVVAVEYPIGRQREFEIDGDILTILIDSVADSKVADPATNTEVLVFVEMTHYVSQLTDLVGAALTAEVAGATSMDVDALLGADVISEDQEFRISTSASAVVNLRETYWVTATITLDGAGAGNGTTTSGNKLKFWPAAESAIIDNAIITFTGSTLTRNLEPIVVLLAAGYALKSYAGFPALTDSEVDLDLGITDLVSAAAITNQINKGGTGAPSNYSNQATIDIQIANAHMSQSRILVQLGQDKINEALAMLERIIPAPASKGTYTRA